MDGLGNLSKSLLALLFYSSVSDWENVIPDSLFVNKKKQNLKEQIALGKMQEWIFLT